jgi:hypothetical protein
LSSGACRFAPAWPWLERRLATYTLDRILWIGLGRYDVPLPAGAMTFDYEAPASAPNFHLIGTAIPADDASLDGVVSVDVWRYLQWGDLCDFVREATRVAPFVLLVSTFSIDTTHWAVRTHDEFNYILRALGVHFDLTVDEEEQFVGVTLRRRSNR